VAIFLTLYQFRFEIAKTLSNLAKKFGAKQKTVARQQAFAGRWRIILDERFECMKEVTL
jgi:hypothetical protein